MARAELLKHTQYFLKLSLLSVLGLAVSLPLSGCVLVGGYRSGGGFFIWPGSLALFVIVLVVMLVLRRGR